MDGVNIDSVHRHPDPPRDRDFGRRWLCRCGGPSLYRVHEAGAVCDACGVFMGWSLIARDWSRAEQGGHAP